LQHCGPTDNANPNRYVSRSANSFPARPFSDSHPRYSTASTASSVEFLYSMQLLHGKCGFCFVLHNWTSLILTTLSSHVCLLCSESPRSTYTSALGLAQTMAMPGTSSLVRSSPVSAHCQYQDVLLCQFVVHQSRWGRLGAPVVQNLSVIWARLREKEGLGREDVVWSKWDYVRDRWVSFYL
jgi:hypothetical protein